MLVWEVAKKYASALFMSVQQRKLVDRVDEQMLALKIVLDKDRALLDYLAAPQIPDENKLELVSSVFGPRLEKILVEFLLLLVRKHRADYLPEIVDAFDRLVKAEKGIGTVTAITAVPMTGDEERRLVKTLQARTGLTIELTKKLDRSILGGMIVIMHNEVIDGSVRHGLQTMKEQLAGVRVH